MFCPNCGKPIDDNVPYCGHCGAQTGVAPTQRGKQSRIATLFARPNGRVYLLFLAAAVLAIVMLAMILGGGKTLTPEETASKYFALLTNGKWEKAQDYRFALPASLDEMGQSSDSSREWCEWCETGRIDRIEFEVDEVRYIRDYVTEEQLNLAEQWIDVLLYTFCPDDQREALREFDFSDVEDLCGVTLEVEWNEDGVRHESELCMVLAKINGIWKVITMIMT